MGARKAGAVVTVGVPHISAQIPTEQATISTAIQVTAIEQWLVKSLRYI